MSFTNNRRQYWSYDNEGHLTSDLQALYSYDAAGRQSEFKANTYVGGWPTSYPTQSVQEVSQTFDGNSAPAKKTTISRWEEMVGEEIQVRQSTTSAYFLRSTVLGGKVVAELSETGTKQLGYVFADEMRIATQYIYLSGSSVGWTSTSPATGSEYMADMFLARKELDPLGTDITYPPQPDLISEPVFYNPKFDQMPLEIEGGPSAEYQRANQAWAREMLAAFYLPQVNELWQSGKYSAAMRILANNPNLGVEYRVFVKNEFTHHGSYFGQDAADFLFGINLAVGMGFLSPVVDGGNQQVLIQDDPETIPSEGSKNCKFTISFKSGEFYENNPNLPNGPADIKYKGNTYRGLGFTVRGKTIGGKGIGYIGTDKNIYNPFGQWTLDQFTSSYAKQNGEFVEIQHKIQSGGEAWRDINLKGYFSATDWTPEFSRYDAPSLPANIPDTYKNQAMLIKVYRGNEVCQASFHIIQRGNSIHWGKGAQGIWPK